MKKKNVPNTPEEKAHAEKRDALMKERPQEWNHIQRERQKIRETKTQEALQQTDSQNIIKFEQPVEGTEIGGMKAFNVEKGEEKHTYQIVTKREITFSYMIRAKNEEDAMIRTLSFVSKDGSGQREDVKRPMYNSKPMIREWIEKIVKVS
jgi:transcription elongation GreA/GreB family factor|tara:strand:+ start:43 stop:492 length:450 start_codon:yes stop_codon:yes gene_type:complete